MLRSFWALILAVALSAGPLTAASGAPAAAAGAATGRLVVFEGFYNPG